MRERHNFDQRTNVLKSDEAKKKYYLVYEGEKTEEIYFDEIISSREKIGINPLIELVPVLRSYSEKNWSNPKKILDRVLKNLRESKTKEISYETLLNWIMEYLEDEKILTSGRKQAESVWDTLIWICKEKLHVDLENTTDDIEETCKKIAAYLGEFTNIENIIDDVPKIIKNRAITYEENFDKICFIIDRDRHSFVSHQENNQYKYVLDKCSEYNFGFFISNPCFEFWLLLHFDEVMQLDENKLLENPKETSKRRYTEHNLRKLLPGYSKSSYNVKSLMEKIDTAIANEKRFCEDDHGLEHCLGSKIGLLIEELRQ